MAHNSDTTLFYMIQALQQNVPRGKSFYGRLQTSDNYDGFLYIDCDEVYPNIYIGNGCVLGILCDN